MTATSLQVAQLVAYVTLTFSSLTVALVSLGFGYRQNFGWKPLALTTGHTLESVADGKSDYTVKLSFEVWNRRKYPVVVRWMEVTFSELELEPVKQHSKQWHVNSALRKLTSNERFVIDPSGHQRFEASAFFKRRTLDDLNDKYTISIALYDPRKNQVKKLTLKGNYTFMS